MSKKDYYEILGASKSATQADLKKAYHKLAMEYHPDRRPNDTEAEKKFKEINAAYDILKDEQKRAAYDQLGHDAFSQTAGRGGFNNQSSGHFHGDINDIFGEFFGDFMGGGSRKRGPASTKIRGSDLKYNLTITLEEAFKGIEKNISFNTAIKCGDCNGTGIEGSGAVIQCNICNGRGVSRIQQGFFTLEQTCSKCNGSGTIIKNPCKKCNGIGRYASQKNLLVNIPSGIETNTKIRLIGEGEAGARDGSNGDLYIFVTIKPHEIYKVENSDLYCRLPISFLKAILGGEIEVPIIEGGKVSLKIPVGTQNGDQLRLKAKGMSKIRSSARGDMFAQIHIEIPKNLTKKQRELLEAFDKENTEENIDDAGFFDKMKNLWS
jgi:molecular chaperone DnaJ